MKLLRIFITNWIVYAAVGMMLSLPSYGWAVCDQPDAPSCGCFNDTGGDWDAGGVTNPGDIFIQDAAWDTVGVRESCNCPGTVDCDWDFDDGGRPYYQMVLGKNYKGDAEYAAKLISESEGSPYWNPYADRQEWCSETISYWHRESHTPYKHGFRNESHLDWQIYSVGDIKLWYYSEMSPGGRGRWIEPQDLDYENFELGVTVPVPGSYVATAAFDDYYDAWAATDLTTHSQMIDEMWVHRDHNGNVFQIEVTRLDGNTGQQVKGSTPSQPRMWTDLLSLIPYGTGRVGTWSGPDETPGTADDLNKKIYGFGVDLDANGQPLYDPNRLHFVDHHEIRPSVSTWAMSPEDEAWEEHSAQLLPGLIVFAKELRAQGGPSVTTTFENASNFTAVPDGSDSTQWRFLAGTSGEVFIDLLRPDPRLIEGIEMTWSPGYLPLGYKVYLVSELTGQSTPVLVEVPVMDFSGVKPSPVYPTPVPAKLDKPQKGFQYVWISFPDETILQQDAVLEELRVLYDHSSWEDTGEVDNEIPVFVDIKPGSCPNSLNPKSKGVVSVALLGTKLLDVDAINPATIKLTRESVGHSVAPLRWNYEDTATPFIGQAGNCHDLNGDRYVDLTLQFDSKELVETLKLWQVLGQTIPLALTGNLKDEFGGTPFVGEDVVFILKKGKE